MDDRFQRPAWWTLASVALGMLLVMPLLAGCAGADCTTSSDCAADQICQAGACAERCADDGDCETNRVCRAGVCELLPRCNEPSDCAGGEVCDDGVCRAQRAECDGDSDCPPSFTCFEGGCYAPGTAPGSGGCAGCQNGEACIDGECVPLDAGTPDVAPADVTPEDAPIATDAEDADDADDAPEPEDTADADAPMTPEVGDDADPVDVVDDAPADVPPEDVAPDLVEDTVADPDTGCRGAADCPEDQICIGGVCTEVPADTGPDVADTSPDTVTCEGAGTRTLGELCSAAADCCSDQCFGIEPRGVCTELCDTWSDCNPEGVARPLFCYTGGGPASQLCAESSYLDACTNRNQCLGGVPGMVCRIPSFVTGLGRCTYQCGATDECAPGSACGPVDLANGTPPAAYVNLCTPVGTPCATFADCLSGLCLEDDAGPNYCTAFCDLGDTASCPSGFVCVGGIDGTLPGFGACVR